MNQPRDDCLHLWLLAGLTILGAWLRLAYLNQPSLWWDEFITIGSALKPLPDMLAMLKHLGPSDAEVELFPPLQHLLVHLLLPLGQSDALMRLPGVIFGAATVPAVYLLCRERLGRTPAILAALLVAVSTYHLHYSREVRPYTLLMLENILALCALQAAVAKNRPGLLAPYGLCVLAMLYTSYMAATLIAGQVLWAGLVLAKNWRQDRWSGLRLGLWLALALALAGLLYLPWLQGQLNVFKLLHDPQARPDFTLAFLERTLEEFAAYAYQGHFPMGWTLAGLGLAGVILALGQGRGSFVLLLALWTAMPLAGIFLAKAHMELTSRYILPLFFFLNIFAAHFSASVVDWLGKKLFPGPAIPLAGLVVAAAALLFLARPNIASLPDYYRRETSHYKELMAYLAENKDNQDMILFTNPRNLKLVYDWYGQGLFSEARHLDGTGYHRAVLLAQAGSGDPGRLAGAEFRTRLGDVDVYSLGLIRQGQVAMLPGPDGRFRYQDDFSGFRMLEDVRQAQNLAPSPHEKVLLPYDSGLPAWGLYRFTVPAGREITGLSLEIKYSVRLSANLPTDAVVSVGLGVDGRAPTQVDRVAMADFTGPDGKPLPPNFEGKRFLTRRLDLTGLCAKAKNLDLRLDFSPALESGAIVLEDLSLDADLSGPPADPAEQASAEYASLAQAVPLVPWRPGQALVASQALHCFTLDPSVPAPNNAQDLTAYLAGHVQDKPVAALSGGRPAFVLYDPALTDPYLGLSPGEPLVVTAGPGTPQIRSLKVSGAMDRPKLSLAGQELTLPVTCPAPAELSVNFQGQARLTFSPLFTQAGLDEKVMAKQGAIGRNPDEDCLSCQDDKPCGLTYALSSDLPVTAFRLTAYPRVFGDPEAKYKVKTLYSLDGRTFHGLADYGGMRGARWEGWKIPQYSRVVLDKPARNLFIRFELTGAKAQLWSAPDARLSLEADLDASNLKGPEIPAWPGSLELQGPPGHGLRVMLLDAPLPSPQAFERTH